MLLLPRCGQRTDMRVFVDTNVLISAALFPNGVAAAAWDKAVHDPNDPVVSDYVIDELRRVFVRKFPDRMAALDAFLAALSSCVEIMPTPEIALCEEADVRDPKDRPVLRAARAARADVLLTGDKDLLESGIDHPRMLSARDFLVC